MFDKHSCNSTLIFEFFLVVMKSSVKILRELLTRGAMLNCVDRHGQTCLMHAVLSGRQEVVKLLVDSGADFAPCNVYQNTALDIARARGLKVIQLLKFVLLVNVQNKSSTEICILKFYT